MLPNPNPRHTHSAVPMSKYGKLWKSIWSDRDFTALDAECQQLYCLLISYPTRTAAGVLPITLNRWASATAGQTPQSVAATLKRLTARRFTVVDWATEEALVRTFIRNDEVYKQPNPMKSALDSMPHVQSPALRWALRIELLRLPTHKWSELAEQIANELVEGLAEPLAEGLAEPLAEPIAEPLAEGSVVVTYLSSKEELQLQPETSTATRRGESATPGAKLVREIVPRDHPPATQTTLRIQASELLKQGTDPEIVAAALRLWCQKPTVGIGRTILSSLCSEVIKTRNGKSKPSGTDMKAHEYLRLAAQLDPTTPALEATK